MSARIYGATNSRISKHLVTVTGEGVFGKNRMILQRRRHCHRFYCRSRLKRITDTKIFPNAVQILQHSFFAHCLNLFFREKWFQISRIIQIKGLVCSHSQNLPIIGICYHHANIFCSRFSVGTICQTIR